IRREDRRRQARPGAHGVRRVTGSIHPPARPHPPDGGDSFSDLHVNGLEFEFTHVPEGPA
ncbi:hypothetical protein, partial [Streptomyces sp. NPDC058953]|uniref:hypothetical protein n=1 Tax=Streptomyces sp. NPDC058953 TaxID=3346676 RepID=UPI003684A1E6